MDQVLNIEHGRWTVVDAYAAKSLLIRVLTSP